MYQQQQVYQQPQVINSYNPQGQGQISGYGTPQQQGIQVQMSPQQNPYYAQQGMHGMQGMYQQQQQLQQQQQYGYGIQVQTIPNQQQQQQPQLYQGMAVQQQQNGNNPYQYQNQNTTPNKQQPLISPTQLSQRFPSQGQAQKSVQQSPKNQQNIGNSPLLSSKNVNTLLPAKMGEQFGGLNAIIPGINIEPIPQNVHVHVIFEKNFYVNFLIEDGRRERRRFNGV